MAVLSAPPASLTYLTNQLSADVTLTDANTYYDGPSVALTAGTWLLTGVVTMFEAAADLNFWTAKLWDGTTVAASAQDEKRAAGNEGRILALTGIAVLTSPATWKISAAGTFAGTLMKAAATVNAAGNTASTLVAVKIA